MKNNLENVILSGNTKTRKEIKFNNAARIEAAFLVLADTY